MKYNNVAQMKMCSIVEKPISTLNCYEPGIWITDQIGINRCLRY